VRAEAQPLQRPGRARQHVVVRERAQQLVMTAARLVRAGQQPVDDTKPRLRADALGGDAVAAVHAAVVARRVFERTHDRRADRDDARLTGTPSLSPRRG